MLLLAWAALTVFFWHTHLYYVYAHGGATNPNAITNQTYELSLHGDVRYITPSQATRLWSGLGLSICLFIGASAIGYLSRKRQRET